MFKILEQDIIENISGDTGKMHKKKKTNINLRCFNNNLLIHILGDITEKDDIPVSTIIENTKNAGMSLKAIS